MEDFFFFFFQDEMEKFVGHWRCKRVYSLLCSYPNHESRHRISSITKMFLLQAILSGAPVNN